MERRQPRAAWPLHLSGRSGREQPGGSSFFPGPLSSDTGSSPDSGTNVLGHLEQALPHLNFKDGGGDPIWLTSYRVADHLVSDPRKLQLKVECSRTGPRLFPSSSSTGSCLTFGPCLPALTSLWDSGLPPWPLPLGQTGRANPAQQQRAINIQGWAHSAARQTCSAPTSRSKLPRGPGRDPCRSLRPSPQAGPQGLVLTESHHKQLTS